MDKKIASLLQLLDEQIKECDKCILGNNGMVKPYWTQYSKYMMVLEAPDELEIKDNSHIVGEKGKRFWKILAEYGFTKRDFLILNTVQCRVINKGNKTGKPSELHRKTCQEWIKKYIKILKPEKILLFGNFAINTMVGQWGIDDFYKKDNLITEEEIYGVRTTIIKSCHPGSIAYEKWREKDLRKSLELLKGD